jgi:hypothetical protein
MKYWIDAALEAGADTIFWDEPHLYISDWEDLNFAPHDAFACFCPRCADSFISHYGHTLPTTLTPEMRRFREDRMLDFLSEMIAYAKAKGADNAITLLPVDEDASESLTWDRIAALPGLDLFGTDPYWFRHNKEYQSYIKQQMQRTMQVCQKHNLIPHFWAQGFGIPVGRESELEAGLSLAAESGARSVAVWGMHGNAAWDGASEDPEAVWDVVGKTFNTLRKV